MDSTELRDRFRLDARDHQTPYLWSDEEIFEFIDDAQKVFCRLTWGIADSTSALTRVACTAGQAWAKYDSRINRIKFIQRASDFREVSVLNVEDIQNGTLPTRVDQSYWSTSLIKLDNTTGTIQYVVTGMESNKFRLVYIPAADETLQMTVYRQPLNSITTKSQEFEIDEKHHIHLLKWVNHRAYGKQDAETYDAKRRDDFGQAFQAYCTLAKEERERREHHPRLMSYGGILMS